MPLPNRPSIEIPLLLELERSRGRVEKSRDFPAFYERVARHFPQLTTEDKKLRRETGGRPLLWQHCIEWARHDLRTKGELNGGERGVWTITQKGRERLHMRSLPELGIADVDGFVRSSCTLPEAAGNKWQPVLLKLRKRTPKGPGTSDVQAPVVQSLPPASEPQPSLSETKPQTREALQPNQEGIEKQLMERLQSLEPKRFEYLVGEFLKAKGLEKITITGRSGDGGVDGECDIRFLKLRCAVQAKRYSSSNPVDALAIRNFKGGVVGRYERGIFLTTSSFTPGAVEEADQPGATLVLINGEHLVRELIDLKLGVKEIPVIERSIDEEFFENLGR